MSGEIKIPYLGKVGTEEFLHKLTTQITEMVSAKITQGKKSQFLIWILFFADNNELDICVTCTATILHKCLNVNQNFST